MELINRIRPRRRNMPGIRVLKRLIVPDITPLTNGVVANLIMIQKQPKVSYKSRLNGPAMKCKRILSILCVSY